MRTNVSNWRWALLLGAAVLGVTLLVASRPALAADACTLLTSEEVAQIIGQRVRKPKPETAQAGTSCRFPTATDTVTISLWPTNAKNFAEARKILEDEGVKIENAPGIGDAAHFWDDDRIYVRVGNQGLTVTLSGGGEGLDPKRRAITLALAKAGVAKLQ